MKNLTIYAALVSLVWMTAVAVCHADSKKPNVVFILSDNQSYYEMSCHGHADTALNTREPAEGREGPQVVDLSQRVGHGPPPKNRGAILSEYRRGESVIGTE